jgi:AcrR family transcriptional regulator
MAQLAQTAATEPESTVEELRSNQILQAVIECVAEGGIDGATMRKVAERIGGSTGMITHYFRSKKQLVADAIAATQAHSFSRIDDTVNNEFGAHRLAAVLDLWLRNPDGDIPPASFWLEYWAEASRDPELQAMSLETAARNREYLARSVAAALENGQFQPGLDPELVADTISALTMGLRVKLAIGHIDSADRAAEIAGLLLGLLARHEDAAPAKPGPA